MSESKSENYITLMKSFYEKLEDKYEQEKYLPIFKAFINDQSNIKSIVDFFMFK
jgi:hypothetical protein